jgi:hypothetical protein
VLVAFAATGCAVNAAGHTQFEQENIDSSVGRAIEDAAFFHPDCSPVNIQVKRVDKEGRLLELSVCGAVRRYQNVSPADYWQTPPGPIWVDVTAATGS